MRNGLAGKRERAIDVACLLCAVCHRLLFGSRVRLRDDPMKRQVERGSQSSRKVRYQIGVSQ